MDSPQKAVFAFSPGVSSEFAELARLLVVTNLAVRFISTKLIGVSRNVNVACLALAFSRRPDATRAPWGPFVDRAASQARRGGRQLASKLVRP